MTQTTRPDRRRNLLAAAVAGGGLLTALVLALLAGRPLAAGLDPADIRDRLDARLRGQETTLRARLSALAALPRLAAAVATDVTTVGDLTEDELPLRPLPGETIMIGQIPTRGVPVVLRVRPSGAVVPPVELKGPRLRMVAGRLLLCDAVSVRPLERADEVRGVLAAGSPPVLDDLVNPLKAAGTAAWLEGGGAAMALVPLPNPAPARWRRIELQMTSPSAAGFTLVLALPGRSPATYLLSAGVLLCASLLLGYLIRTGRSAPAPQPAGAETTRPPTPGPQPPPVETAETTRPPTPGPQLPPVEILEPASTPAPKRQPPPLPPTSRAFRTQTPEPSPPPQPGRVGRYEILRLIDAGGTAEVYLARFAGESEEDGLVALKVLQGAFARQPEVVDLFLDEARLASLISHPNVVQVLDVGRSQDQYFIAMEYVDGADLDRLRGLVRRAGRLISVPIVLGILRRICEGLQAAHGATAPDGTPLGLVHRDVKSANVLVGRSGLVKVGDFGIARASHALRARRTDAGVVRGTPGSMSPEQRLGHPLDLRTDVFGVGVIAYEMLSGAPLNLEPPTQNSAGWPHLRLPSALRPEAPPELDEVVMLAMAFDRETRFQSCAEIEQAVERIANRHAPIATDHEIAAWVEATLAADRPRERPSGGIGTPIRN